jgi:hypothetical protein
MMKLLTAIALATALPAAAHAADPAPQPKQDCCEKMKHDGKECCCCKDMDHKGHAEHGGHDSSPSEHEAHQH